MEHLKYTLQRTSILLKQPTVICVLQTKLSPYPCNKKFPTCTPPAKNQTEPSERFLKKAQNLTNEEL